MVENLYKPLRELAQRVNELPVSACHTALQDGICTELLRLANQDETWEKAFGWVLSECVPTRDLIKQTATVGDTVRWLKGRVETAERLEHEVSGRADAAPPDGWGRVPKSITEVDVAPHYSPSERRAYAAGFNWCVAMAQTTMAESPAAPIPMILHCPRCQLQHTDAEDRTPWPPVPHGVECEIDPEAYMGVTWSDGITREPKWTNPPHRSHLCAGCGFIWRPADVPTIGVAAITTRGQNDSDPVSGKAMTLRELAMQVLGYTEEYVDEILKDLSGSLQAVTYVVPSPELTEAQRAGVADYVKRNGGSVVRAMRDNGLDPNVEQLAGRFEAMHARGDKWVTTIAAATMCRGLAESISAQDGPQAPPR